MFKMKKVLLVFVIFFFIAFVSAVTDISTCRDLDTANTVYNLTSDVYSDKRCFNITADNITLQGNGFTVYHGQTGISGEGLWATGYDNWTLQDINFVMNSSATNADGIEFTGCKNALIQNTNISVSDGSGLGDGIAFFNSNHTKIENVIINMSKATNMGKGILIEGVNGHMLNITLKDITIYQYGSNTHGINIDDSSTSIDNVTLTNIKIYGDASSNTDGIHWNIDNNNKELNYNVTNLFIDNMGRYGIYFDTYSNRGITNPLVDVNISGTHDADLYVQNGFLDVLNATYVTELVEAGDKLMRKWYFDVHVIDGVGANVDGANVTATNTSGDVQFSVLTGADGKIAQQQVIQYVNSSGTTIDYNDYTLTVTKSGYVTNSSTITITTNQNLQKTIEQDNSPPDLSIAYPSNNSNHSTTNVNINYTVSDSGVGVDSCWYSNDSGITNNTIGGCANLTSYNWDEGTNTVIIYANDTLNNINSTSVTFLVETQESITFCRDLNLANTVYNLTNSIYSATTCMNVLANNITLNCNNKRIFGDGGLSDYGISSNGYNDFKLNNCSIENFGTNLYVENSDNFVVRDSQLTNTTQYGIYLVTSAGNNSVYNTTYDLSEEFVGGTSDLTRYWDYRAYVNDTAGNVVSNANVTGYNITGSWVFNTTTDATGYTPTQELISYINNAGTRTDYNNYTFYALNYSAPPYVQTLVNTTLNLTLETSIYKNVFTLTYDATNPLISYGTGTEVDNYNASRTWVYVNITYTEDNFKNITFTLKNDTDTINSTTFTTATYTINWTGLAENNYTYYLNITDGANNKNSTEVRNIRLDTTPPSITIDQPPASKTYATNISLPLNYTTTDEFMVISSCWYNLINNTGDYLITNTTIANCVNTTFNVSQGSGSYTLTLYSNDSLNNVNSTNRSFSISLAAPAVNLIYPTDNLHLNSITNIQFNYTAEDTNGVNACERWGNWTGIWHKNSTIGHGDDTSVTSDEGNFTMNLTEGTFKWNVYCNDSLNQYSWGASNFTFTLDTTNPLVNITSPANNSVLTGLSQTITYNISDSHINTCYFTLRDSVGALHNYAENTSVTCSEAGSRSISALAYGTYYFYLTGKDKAGNENTTSVRFSLIPPPETPGGGGGGTTIIVGAEANWTMTTETGSSKYQFNMIPDSSRKRNILLENLGNEERTIMFDCVLDLCDYLTIEKQTMVLPIQKEIKEAISFTIDLPENIEPKKYITNIIGTDDLGNKNILTLEINVGKFGILSEIFVKLASSRTLFDGFSLPYWFIFALTIAIFTVSAHFIGVRKLPAGLLFSMGIGFFSGIVLLLFI